MSTWNEAKHPRDENGRFLSLDGLTTELDKASRNGDDETVKNLENVIIEKHPTSEKAQEILSRTYGVSSQPKRVTPSPETIDYQGIQREFDYIAGNLSEDDFYDPIIKDDGTEVTSLYDFYRNPKLSMGECHTVSSAVEEWYHSNGDPEYEAEIIEESPQGKYLTTHVANLFTHSETGEQFVIDYTHAQIDTESDFPYIGTVDEWKAKVHHASENPISEVLEEYSQ